MLEWNDDERDTSHNLNLQSNILSKKETYIPIGDIMREIHNDNNKEKYTWTHQDYIDETSRRKAKMYVARPLLMPLKIVPLSQKQDINIDEEFTTNTATISASVATASLAESEYNNEIMDKQIYRKCMYS